MYNRLDILGGCFSQILAKIRGCLRKILIYKRLNMQNYPLFFANQEKSKLPRSGVTMISGSTLVRKICWIALNVAPVAE